jgi:tetratricopeptide (TPR) repeat protein
LAKLARVALRQDLTEKALELHEDSLQQREGMRENQAVELNKERALTFVELGEIEKARAFTRQFSKSHEYRHLINSAIDRQEVAEGAVPGDDSVLLPADHIELAQRALAQDNGPLATILLKKAHTMLQNYDQWTRLSLLPEIAEGLMEAGEEKMAKLVAAQHTELSLTMTSQLENKVAMMTTSANLYTQLGESPESVNKLLDLADSVKETPGPVWFGHTYGALGKGYYQAGREERAYEIWAQGLERLRENINPRVRAFGSAEIFLAMHSAKAPLKECVKNVADDIGHSL